MAVINLRMSSVLLKVVGVEQGVEVLNAPVSHIPTVNFFDFHYHYYLPFLGPRTYLAPLLSFQFVCVSP